MFIITQPENIYIPTSSRTPMDEAEKYLRRVAQIQRNKFGSSGFISVCAATPSTSEDHGSSLPPRRKRSRGTGEPINSPATESLTPVENTTGSSSKTAPVVRRSLMDKWFPGDVLKVSTIELSCAPPLSYIELTTERITAMREKILQLRCGIEDVEAALNGHQPVTTTAKETQDDDDLPKECVRSLRSAFQQFAARPATTIRSTMRQFQEFQRAKNAMNSPANPNASAWHRFLNENGPETMKCPQMSNFLWTSSASVTLLFTILVQRFLKQFRTLTSSSYSQETDGGASSEVPNVIDSFPPKQRELLIFLRLFMPTTSSDQKSSVSSGFSVWLLSCLCVLDTPLDPDTDRLASSLFNACCNQVRVIGEVTKVSGDQRGLLLETLIQKKDDQKSMPKAYDTLSDVGPEEILALYTIIIILTKVFRQNQNRLIPLS